MDLFGALTYHVGFAAGVSESINVYCRAETETRESDQLQRDVFPDGPMAFLMGMGAKGSLVNAVQTTRPRILAEPSRGVLHDGSQNAITVVDQLA